jgi:pantetheine-phosphate adenylyltransferase
MKFKRVAVGGTFDYLHDGHMAILAKAFEAGERVVIGITSDEMQPAKDLAGIQPLSVRRKALEDALHSRGWMERAEICVISDPFGPAIDDEKLEAIVVSPETRPRAEELNKLRASRGLAPLHIIEIPFVLAEDGSPISSIRIRYGEMDTHGRLLKRQELA